MGTGAVQINGIVGILNKFSPQSLESLKNNNPEFEELLKPGITMERNDSTSKQVNHAYQKFLAEVSLEGMKEALRLCDLAIPQLKKKLIISGKLKFLGQIIAVLGGASIFTLLSQSETYAQTAKYISAGLVLVGTILPLSAQYAEGGFLQGADNLSKSYEDLLDCKVQSSQISPMVEYCLKNDLLEPISELTEKANDLSVKIRNIIQKKTSLT